MTKKLQLCVITIICLYYTSTQITAYPTFLLDHPVVTTTPFGADKTINREEAARDVTVHHVANYSISFVPIVTLLLNMIPKIINRITQFQQNGTQQTKAIDTPPTEFSGANPCLDSILTTREYPGSSCHFYQCVIHQPASIKCLLQVIEDSTIGDTTPNNPTYKMNAAMSSFVTSVKISECISIRIYKCLPGYKFSKKANICVRDTEYFDKRNICGT